MAGETILVVEDEPALRELVREILETAGFRVATAANGRKGLEALARLTPHLVLSDIKMPLMDGYQFYRQVRSHPEWDAIPFVFLSSKGDSDDIREGKQLGVDDYVVKPFRSDDLLVAVRARLGRRAQLDAARERQVNEVKRAILGTLNHEFRTPLTWLAGYAELLKEGGEALNPEQLRTLMDGILAGSERLGRLVEDLVILVDLHSGAAHQRFERQRGVLEDLSGLLRDAVGRDTARAAARGVSLVAELPETLPPVVGDRELLGHAVSRLIDNGIKFSKREGGNVTIEVRDEGVGIRAEELEKISEMFYQSDRRRLEQQGVGSGLTIARGIVTLHGGSLAVDSRLGQGTTSRITLPTAS
jgi:two-component system, sensor histidine kinase and response regulator